MSDPYDHTSVPINLPSSAWKTPQKFTLECERRDDGGLRVTSPGVPGLVLSHHDMHLVLRDVPSAIDTLMKHNT